MESPQMIVQLPPVPVMHWKRFAELIGVEEEIVRGFCEKGYLPHLTIGKHRFINLAQFTQRCLTETE